MATLPRSPLPPVGLFGHAGLQRRFRDAIARGNLPASLLLHGWRGVGKQRLGLWLGQLLLCVGEGERPCGSCQSCRYATRFGHPDLHWFFPRPRLKDGDPSPEDVQADYAEAIGDRLEANGLYAAPPGDEAIFVATVRAIVSSAALSPAVGARKIYLIGDADRMVPQTGADQAANAFLKLLEEPPANTTIVLTSSEPGALLPTIRSRAVAVRVPTLSDGDVRRFLADPAVAQRVAADHGALATDSLVTLAAGAPGRLFGQDTWAAAMIHARALADAARSPDPTVAIKAAFMQGGSKARGRFSDTLDALTAVLHAEARLAATSNDGGRARRVARGVEIVERAKELAAGNVNPQLITSVLLRDLSPLIK
jgi:DNA polymerase III subunit delta'